MSDFLNIAVPLKPEVLEESKTFGRYQISGLHPGYGQTLGNALRRMLLSSIPGAAVTTIRIKGVPHEFSTIDGVKEDVLNLVVRLKKLRVETHTEEFPQTLTLVKKGKGVITAGDFKTPSQIKIVNPELVLAEITNDKTELNIEVDIERGIGFQPREEIQKKKEVGSIFVDAVFSPVKRSIYEVENMRKGSRTDYNRLIVSIETDGSVSPRVALETSIKTMITQFQAMIGFQLDEEKDVEKMEEDIVDSVSSMKIKDLNLSASVQNSLEKGGIKTVAGLLKKGNAGLKEVSGVGDKAVEEVSKTLAELGVVLK